MNKKITFPELVEAVALATETSKRVSETFLKELFSLIADTLREGENVQVRGLGVFKLSEVESRKSVNVNTGEEMEIPSHRKVVFIPDKALADSINTPFANFETIVLSDDITDAEMERLESVEGFDVALDSADSKVEEPKVEDNNKVMPPPFNPIETAEEPIGRMGSSNEDSEVETVETVVESIEEPIVEQKEDVDGSQIEIIELQKESQHINDAAATEEECVGVVADESDGTDNDSVNVAVKPIMSIPEDDDEEEEYVVKESKQNDKSFMRGFVWGAVTMFVIYLIAGIAIYFYHNYSISKEKEEARAAEIADSLAQVIEVENVMTAKTDSILAESSEINKPQNEDQIRVADVATIKTPEVKYDTVTRTKFLTRIARKYYGNSDFWVYIYEENKSKIKNPNTISPGTVVIIPPAEKYGIDKDDKESLKKARKKAAEIEAKYK